MPMSAAPDGDDERADDGVGHAAARGRSLSAWQLREEGPFQALDAAHDDL